MQSQLHLAGLHLSLWMIAILFFMELVCGVVLYYFLFKPKSFYIG